MVADGAPAPSSPTHDFRPRLYARAGLGIRLGLDAMRDVCERAGGPERAFTSVHIAGTNGKGSTSAMIESVARAAGRRTGLYTSPHLCRFAERIQIDGAPIADAPLADAVLRALALGPELSFFEVATLAAFLAFRDAGVELCVIETGLGGRLDATNVLPSPACTAITNVGLDHTDKLGATLAEIAGEKAHIVKAGAPMIVGPIPPDARREVARIGAPFGVTPLHVEDEEARAKLLPELAGDAADLHLNLAGAHQVHNARVADLVCDALGIAAPHRRAGLTRARWPGRLELLHLPEGRVLLDGAHNADGAEALARALADGAWGCSPGAAVAAEQTAIVFGALLDKDAAAMVAKLEHRAHHWVFAAPGARASHDPAALASRFGGVAAATIPEALAAARAAVGPGGLVVACGSLHLVGAVRARLLDLPSDPPVAL